MSKRPNILFIFTDDQRFDTLSALRKGVSEHIRTFLPDWKKGKPMSFRIKAGQCASEGQRLTGRMGSEAAVADVTAHKLKSLAAGKMGFSTTEDGDLVAERVA